MSSRVLIMAGGTGGHVFPALAVANLLRSNGHQVEWLGTAAGIEARLVPDAGIKLNTIAVKGLRGKSKASLVLAPFKLLWAIYQALAVIRQFKPNAVLGMGGFASGPGAVAAWLSGSPLVIHEQNAIAGFTNTQSRRFAKRVLQAFPQAFKTGDQGEVVGNPIRGPILQLAKPADRFERREGPIRILVIGGSLGALAINELLPKALAMQPPTGRFEVIHQTGAKHLETTQAAYLNAGVEAEIVPFIEAMDEAYAWADLVICRAGALTVSEIAIAGVAALFIPFPYAVDDHQTANAAYLVNLGAADLITQNALTAENLYNWLIDHQSREELLIMAERARDLGRPEATQRVADICMEVCRES